MSDEDARQRLLRLVRTYPGLHLRELARQAGQSEALAGYHAKELVETGRIDVRPDGAYRRYYPTPSTPSKAADAAERDVLALVRQRAPLQILLVLLESGPMTHTQITARVGLAKSTVSYHLVKLLEADVVAQARGQGFRVVDPEAIRALIADHRPPPGLVSRFEALWDRFYRSQR